MKWLDGCFRKYEEFIDSKFNAFEKRIQTNSTQTDKLRSDTNNRLSRIEVLFLKELEEKEKLRDELLKNKRLKRGE